MNSSERTAELTWTGEVDIATIGPLIDEPEAALVDPATAHLLIDLAAV